MIKISVITICYNSNLLIESTIKSVLEQKNCNLEYLIIDGGSTDGTVEIINKYIDKIDYFVSESDNGIYDAINKGILRSSGDYIAFLHSGDIFYSDSILHKMSLAISLNKEIAIFYSNVIFINNVIDRNITRVYSSKYFRCYLFLFGFMPAHTSTFIKRDTYIINGLYETDYKIAGDFELMFRYMLINKLSFKYLNIFTTFMTNGGVSTSGIKSTIKLNSEILKAIKANNYFSNYIFLYMKYLIKIFQFRI